ncbi:hypothetical protein RUM43_004719 [Polyplax serrata]|uniref:Uncharacterized protein n=1 Tax=Polyplax serrata TaxID=468196 RepID=A0AAN8SB61_POLSC
MSNGTSKIGHKTLPADTFGKNLLTARVKSQKDTAKYPVQKEIFSKKLRKHQADFSRKIPPTPPPTTLSFTRKPREKPLVENSWGSLLKMSSWYHSQCSCTSRKQKLVVEWKNFD